LIGFQRQPTYATGKGWPLEGVTVKSNYIIWMLKDDCGLLKLEVKNDFRIYLTYDSD